MADGPVPVPIVVTITADPATGALNFNGPLDNPQLCADILAAAQRLVMAHALKKTEPPKPSSGLVLAKAGPAMPNGHGGRLRFDGSQ